MLKYNNVKVPTNSAVHSFESFFYKSKLCFMSMKKSQKTIHFSYCSSVQVSDWQQWRPSLHRMSSMILAKKFIEAEEKISILSLHMYEHM